MAAQSPPNGGSFPFAEFEELKKLLPEMVRFEPTWEELELFKDGGVAIIDQWVCAHARCVSHQVHGLCVLRAAHREVPVTEHP